MADVIELDDGEDLPTSGEWVLVSVEVLGNTGLTSLHSMGRTFHSSRVESDIIETVHRACEWADAHGAQKVYVKRERRNAQGT